MEKIWISIKDNPPAIGQRVQLKQDNIIINALWFGTYFEWLNAPYENGICLITIPTHYI